MVSTYLKTNVIENACAIKENFFSAITSEKNLQNFKERQRFVKVLTTVATNPIFRDKYRGLGRRHSKMPSKLLHHMPQIFLPGTDGICWNLKTFFAR